jgi:DNA/RNA-binding domain of Phe-tRNA-synthetase-like protein
MVQIEATKIIREKIPGFKLGVVEVRGATVTNDCPQFEPLFNELTSYLKKHFERQPLSSNEVIGHVRRMYRRVGWEPTKYRPSSEALARRILQGKGWYRINNAVDLGNIVSARFHLPMGLYDVSKIEGQILLDVGKPDETYDGISRQAIHAEGKLILRDDLGIFGNPTSDSKRTSLTPASEHLLALFFTPPEVDDAYLDETLNTLMEYYRPFGKRLEKQIIKF